MEPGLIVVSALSAYLLGSIPSGYLAGRLLKGIDIRASGSGNVGALNTLHQVGAMAAILVLASDIVKAALAVLIAGWLVESDWGTFTAAVAVVAGHNWPVFLGFQGGKGAAPVLGVSFVLVPWLTLITVAFASPVVVLTRNVVIAATLGFIVLNTLTVATEKGWSPIFLCLLLTLLVFGTYLARSRKQSLDAIRRRRWTDLFSFE